MIQRVDLSLSYEQVSGKRKICTHLQKYIIKIYT